MTFLVVIAGLATVQCVLLTLISFGMEKVELLSPTIIALLLSAIIATASLTKVLL